MSRAQKMMTGLALVITSVIFAAVAMVRASKPVDLGRNPGEGTDKS